MRSPRASASRNLSKGVGALSSVSWNAASALAMSTRTASSSVGRGRRTERPSIAARELLVVPHQVGDVAGVRSQLPRVEHRPYALRPQAVRGAVPAEPAAEPHVHERRRVAVHLGDRGAARLVVRPVALGNVAGSARELPAPRQAVSKNRRSPNSIASRLPETRLLGSFFPGTGHGPWARMARISSSVICQAPVGNVGPAHPRKERSCRRQHTPEDVFRLSYRLPGRSLVLDRAIQSKSGHGAIVRSSGPYPIAEPQHEARSHEGTPDSRGVFVPSYPASFVSSCSGFADLRYSQAARLRTPRIAVGRQALDEHDEVLLFPRGKPQRLQEPLAVRVQPVEVQLGVVAH